MEGDVQFSIIKREDVVVALKGSWVRGGRLKREEVGVPFPLTLQHSTTKKEDA